MSVIPLDEVTDAIAAKALTPSQTEQLQRMLDAAEAEYAALLGPLEPTPVTEVVQSSRRILLSRGRVQNLVSVVDSAGRTIDLAGWDVSPAGTLRSTRTTYGRLTVTYTAGGLPANDRLMIVTDVAELWSRTQRGSGTGRPGFGGEGSESEPVRPMVPFPRIRSLVPSLVP